MPSPNLLLELSPRGGDRFEGAPGGGDERRTYGGLIVAQALAAAAATTNGAPCNALHLLFAGAGDATRPAALTVERLRDGRSFCARGVRVEQGGRLLAAATLSFHGGDDGPAYQVAMPDAPAPETLPDQRDLRRRNAEARGRPMRRSVAEDLVDARPFEPPIEAVEGGVSAERLLWFRSREALGDEPALHQAMIAFASDMGLVHLGMTVSNVLGGSAKLDAASLDHAVWFHRPARADAWLLHVQRAEVAQAGRGLVRGTIFTREGVLVASVAQEVLIRHAAA